MHIKRKYLVRKKYSVFFILWQTFYMQIFKLATSKNSDFDREKNWLYFLI